jgi:hypothetical protein
VGGSGGSDTWTQGREGKDKGGAGGQGRGEIRYFGSVCAELLGEEAKRRAGQASQGQAKGSERTQAPGETAGCSSQMRQ